MIIDKKTLNCNGRLVVLEKPMVMGIINSTIDSFYKESRVASTEEAFDRASQMLEDGADIIDVGAASTRPGATRVSVEQELENVIPIVSKIQEYNPDALISVDTYHSVVAKAAVDAGASMINDVSAGRMDSSMYATVGALKVPYILMHMQGDPSTMQNNPSYQNVGLEVMDFFIAEIAKLREHLVADIIIDPGFGFGKTIAHNYELMNALHTFRFLECPIMVGISRKSMIYKPLNISAEEALNGTIALHMKALQEGAQFLRVHDVKPAIETVKIWQLLEANQITTKV